MNIDGVEYSLQMCGRVIPPEGIMRVARLELSEAGFARLMETTGGIDPTPYQLAREVEFEREGRYPPEDLMPPRLIQIARDAALIATAISELSHEGFKRLITSIDFRAPTAHELVAAVEAERVTAVEFTAN